MMHTPLRRRAAGARLRSVRSGPARPPGFRPARAWPRQRRGYRDAGRFRRRSSGDSDSAHPSSFPPGPRGLSPALFGDFPRPCPPRCRRLRRGRPQRRHRERRRLASGRATQSPAPVCSSCIAARRRGRARPPPSRRCGYAMRWGGNRDEYVISARGRASCESRLLRTGQIGNVDADQLHIFSFYPSGINTFSQASLVCVLPPRRPALYHGVFCRA